VDLLDVLRRQAGRFACPDCGYSLADCRLELITQAGSQGVVQITCAHCEASRTVGVAVASPAVSPTPLDQPVNGGPPAITADEVLDVRLALQGHPGDLRSLID